MPKPFVQTNPELDSQQNSSLLLLWFLYIYHLLHNAPCICSDADLCREMSPYKPLYWYVLVFVKVWPLVQCSPDLSTSCPGSSLSWSRNSCLLAYDELCTPVRMTHCLSSLLYRRLPSVSIFKILISSDFKFSSQSSIINKWNSLTACWKDSQSKLTESPWANTNQISNS